MVGQERLTDDVFSYTIDDLPKTMMFCGSRGCGKHTICKELGERLSLRVVDITEKVSFESIVSIYKDPTPTLYVLDASKMDDRKQNMVLKFIEEPLDGSFIALLCDSPSSTLDTVWGRCRKFRFDKYEKKDLLKFAPDDPEAEFIADVCSTPGQVLETTGKQCRETRELASKFVRSLHMASLPNTLTLLNRFNYNDEYDKINIIMFLSMVLAESTNALKYNYSDYLAKLVKMTSQTMYDMNNGAFSKEPMMEAYLIRSWKESKGD